MENGHHIDNSQEISDGLSRVAREIVNNSVTASRYKQSGENSTIVYTDMHTNDPIFKELVSSFIKSDDTIIFDFNLSPYSCFVPWEDKDLLKYVLPESEEEKGIAFIYNANKRTKINWPAQHKIVVGHYSPGGESLDDRIEPETLYKFWAGKSPIRDIKRSEIREDFQLPPEKLFRTFVVLAESYEKLDTRIQNFAKYQTKIMLEMMYGL